MAELKLVYSELEDASSNAKKVAKKCQDYIDELDEKLSQKWSTVPKTPLSTGSQRIDSAAYYVNQKKKKLAEKKKDYNAFAESIDNLISDAKEADKNVAKSVNDSQKKFLNAHKNLSGDDWTAFFASIVVDVPVIGAIVDGVSTVIEGAKDLGNNIRHWYEVCGGKKIIDTALAIGEAVLAVAALVTAILAFPVSGILAGIAAVAGIIGGVIGCIDAGVNLYNQIKANKESDPAWSKYYGGIDKASDALRKTTFKSKLLNKWSEGIAFALDITSTVCAVISLGKELVEGIGKAYKRSGLNKLFSKKHMVTVKGVTKPQYKFDFTKFLSTILSKDGRAAIKKSLKYSWKGLLFGDKGGVAGWKKRWKRAFTSKFTYKKNISVVKKLYDRGKKIYDVVKTDFKTLTNSYKTITNMIDVIRKKDYSAKNLYTNIKNIYKIAGGDGAIVNTVTDAVDSGIDIYDSMNEKIKKTIQEKIKRLVS